MAAYKQVLEAALEASGDPALGLRAPAMNHPRALPSMQDVARELEAGPLTIQEVADAMGFADAPAFYRAFRRWTGLTPRKYVASVLR